MKDLKDDGRDQCESDNDKLQALVERSFFTRHQEFELLEVRAEGGGGHSPGELEDSRYSVEELEEKVRTALRGTSNK